MPLYEYLCESCGRSFEAIQRFSEAPLTTCDRCGGTLKKLLSAPAFQFKGSGWYVSDYGRPGGGTKSADEGGKKDSEASKESAAKESAAKESDSKESPSGKSSSKENSAKDGFSKDVASKKDGKVRSSGKDS